MRVLRTSAVTGLTVAAVGVILAAGAWACVSGPAVLLNTATIKAGETVQIKATNFTKPESVVVRFNALDGPVLADLGAPKSGGLSGEVTIPAGTAPGNYVLVFTQTSADGKPSQVPARSLITVTGDSGAKPVLGATPAAPSSGRLDRLASSHQTVSGGTLAMISVGVAGIALFLAGIAALMATRRTDRPVAAKARG
jgi:methionine-rich copper-binding protein CopC